MLHQNDESRKIDNIKRQGCTSGQNYCGKIGDKHHGKWLLHTYCKNAGIEPTWSLLPRLQNDSKIVRGWMHRFQIICIKMPIKMMVDLFWKVPPCKRNYKIVRHCCWAVSWWNRLRLLWVPGSGIGMCGRPSSSPETLRSVRRSCPLTRQERYTSYALSRSTRTQNGSNQNDG